MSHFRLGQRSLKTLATVDERMQRVVKRAIELTAVDFVVVQGRRTHDEQSQLYGQGRTAAQMLAAGLSEFHAKPGVPKVTWTMKSNHLTGRAVDLAAFVEGQIVWTPTKLYFSIAEAMSHAAEIEKVAIDWGGHWTKNKDYPHFELRKGT